MRPRVLWIVNGDGENVKVDEQKQMVLDFGNRNRK